MRAKGCHVSLQIDPIHDTKIRYQVIIVKERDKFDLLQIVEPILVIERTACQIL